MTNLNKLQNTTFNLGGDKLKFIVGTTSGDNLVLNPLAGLSASFNHFVKFPCRQCPVKQEDYRNCGGPEKFFQLAKNLRNEDPVVGVDGIEDKSPLAAIHGFKVGKDLPGDVFHNFHGGVGKLYYGLAIKSLLKTKKINFFELQKNYQIINLQSGRHKTNPMPTLSKTHWMSNAIPEFQGSFSEYITTIMITPLAFANFENYQDICKSKEYLMLKVLGKLTDLFSRRQLTEGEIQKIEKLQKQLVRLRMNLTRNPNYFRELKQYKEREMLRKKKKDPPLPKI